MVDEPRLAGARAQGEWRRMLLLWSVMAAVVANLVLAPSYSSDEGSGLGVYAWIATLAYVMPGILLLMRRRWHVVGWLLLVYGAEMAISFSGDWAAATTGGPWLRLLVDRTQGSLFWLPIVWLLVWFPDGLRERPRQQRVFGKALISTTAAMCLIELLSETTRLDIGLEEPSPLGPLAIVPRDVSTDAVFVITLLTIVVAGIGLVRRYRWARSTTRLQYRWVVSALLLLVVALAIGIAGSTLAGDGWWWLPILVAYLTLPFAFAVAITRYRLYEIDRIVSRALAYTLIIGALTTVFVASIALLSGLVPSQDRVVVAATTVAVVALFNPLRRRVLDVVDKRFDRTRYIAAQVIETFGRAVHDEIDLADVQARLHDTISRTIAPSTIALWLPAPATRAPSPLRRRAQGD